MNDAKKLVIVHRKDAEDAKTIIIFFYERKYSANCNQIRIIIRLDHCFQLSRLLTER